MASDEPMDYDDIDEMSEPEESSKVDPRWEELDDEGFKKLELATYNAYLQECVLRPEDEREDKDEWAESYADANNLDIKRVRAVTILGIYAGERNEYNERHGKGHAKYPNGDTYIGEFQNSKRHGKGQYVHAAYSYEPSPFLTVLRDKWLALPLPRDAGTFAQEMAVSLQTSPELISEILQIVEDTKCDFRPTYSGEWVGGRPHGQGVALSPDGTVTKGTFVAGRRHGHCVVLYPNGDRYYGEYRDGKRHGHGTYVYSMWTWSQGGAIPDAVAATRAGPKSGGRLVGHWEGGRLVRGSWLCTDGVVFHGEFDYKSRPEVRKFQSIIFFCYLHDRGKEPLDSQLLV